jgi:hypothetical protein
MGTRRGSDNVLRLEWFNLCLDPFFKENPNPKRKFKILIVGPYTAISGMGMGRGLGDLPQFGWFNLHLDPFFEESQNIKTGSS